MSSQVGLNTSYLGNNFYNNIGTTNTSFNPLTFGNNSNNNMLNLAPISNDYSNDIMMASLDSIFAAGNMQQNINQTTKQNTNNPYNNTQMPNYYNSLDPAFSSQQTYTTNPTEPDMSELDGCLAAKDKNIAYTENNNPYKKTNTAKTAGAFLGFLAPAAGKIVKLFQGGSFKDLFKLKHMAIACPALALAGLGVGYLIDGYTNSKRAAKADENAIAKQNYNPQNYQNLA